MGKEMFEAIPPSETTQPRPVTDRGHLGRISRSFRAMVAALVLSSALPMPARTENEVPSAPSSVITMEDDASSDMDMQADADEEEDDSPATVTAEDEVPSTITPQGKLFIAGGGVLSPKLRKEFIKLGGGKKARVVIIPTANDHADDLTLRHTFVWEEFNDNVEKVDFFHTRDRDVANDETETAILDDATAVWFPGGKQLDLAAAYVKTRTLEKIAAVLQRGGVVGGTSAGAAVVSGVMIGGSYDHDPDQPIISEGFNFLPRIVVDQHFLIRERQRRLENAINEHPDHFGLGIDEGTAIIITGNEAVVMGKSTVTIVQSDGGVIVLGNNRRVKLSDYRPQVILAP